MGCETYSIASRTSFLVRKKISSLKRFQFEWEKHVFVWHCCWCWDECTIPFGLRVPILCLSSGASVMLKYAWEWNVCQWVQCYLVEASFFSLRWVFYYMFIYCNFWYICAHGSNFVVVYMDVCGIHEIWYIYFLYGFRWKHSYMILFMLIWL